MKISKIILLAATLMTLGFATAQGAEHHGVQAANKKDSLPILRNLSVDEELVFHSDDPTDQTIEFSRFRGGDYYIGVVGSDRYSGLSFDVRSQDDEILVGAEGKGSAIGIFNLPGLKSYTMTIDSFDLYGHRAPINNVYVFIERVDTPGENDLDQMLTFTADDFTDQELTFSGFESGDYFMGLVGSDRSSGIAFVTKTLDDENLIGGEGIHTVFGLEYMDGRQTYTITVDSYDEFGYQDEINEVHVIFKKKAITRTITMEPRDFGFEQQYFFDERTKTHAVGGLELETTRLRTGFIENEYVVLSARRAAAGVAQITYDLKREVIGGVRIDLALWSNSELLRSSDCTATIQYRDDAGPWVTVLDLLNDVTLPTDRNVPETYEIFFPTTATEFRVHTTAPAVGSSKNTGRLCIGTVEMIY